MSDLKIAPAAPVPATPGTAGQPGQPPAGHGERPAAHGGPAVTLSGTVNALAEEQRLEGVVAGQDGAGRAILRTSSGTYLLSLNADHQLAANTRLVLQILSAGGDIRASIVSENGVPVDPPLPVRLTAWSGGPAAADPMLPELAARTGTSIATVVGEPLAAAPRPAGALPPGSMLVVRIEAAAQAVPAAPATPPAGATPAALPPGATTASVATAAAGAAAGLAPSAAAGGIPRDAATASLAGPPGSATSASVAATASPAGAAPAAGEALRPGGMPAPGSTNDASPPASLAGTVVAEGPAGRILVRTAAGLLSVEAPVPPPPAGSTLSLEVVVTRLAPVPVPIPAEADGRLPLLPGHDWPALRDTLEALRNTDPELAARLLQNTLPRPDSRLASSLLFFVSALRSGDLGGWLGRDTLSRLEQSGRGDLARRLGEDFGQLARNAQENSPTDWKSWLLPLFDGRAVTPITLFARQQREREDRRNGKGGTRFIVDFELSSGHLQLDGLADAERLDLVVRTQAPLPGSMRADIGQIFDDVLGASGSKGSVAFQVMRQFPEPPLEVLQGSRAGTAVVV